MSSLVQTIGSGFFQRVTNDSFYATSGGLGSGIFSASTGLPLWDGPTASMGTVAGQYVVYSASPPNEIAITAY